MATKRKTGKDYRKELSELYSKERNLKLTVNQRLLELVKAYPMFDLPTSRAGGLKCHEIDHPWIVDETNIEAVIEYIEAIEKQLADKHPHKQTKMKFEDVCNCDGRDMPVYKEDGKYWCPQCGYEVK